MDIVRCRAVDPALVIDPEIAPHALRKGFPFLVDTKTEQIIEPVCRYLLWKAGRGQRVSPNTLDAYAEDLKEWFYYLAYYGDYETDGPWPWDAIDETFIEQYLCSLADEISSKTGAPYSADTIHRRASTIINFYVWAADKAYLKEKIDFKWKRQSKPPGHRSALNRSKQRLVSGLIPQRRSVPPPIKIIEPPEYERLLKALGVRPSRRNALMATSGPSLEERQAVQGVSSRDFLIAEWGLQVGMRIDEILSLELWQILALAEHSEGHTLGSVRLRIDKTKGLIPREVPVPAWLIDDTVAYIDGEREEAQRTIKTLKSPSALFLHHPWAKNPSHEGVRYRTVHNIFSRACMRAGLTETTPSHRPEAYELPKLERPKYHHHVLRHTYAAYYYLFAVAQGISEPWKRLQSVLGHRHLETTINTYMRAFSLLDPSGLHGRIAERFQETFRDR